MTILYIALTICLVAVLFLTGGEARHFKKTQSRGNARIMSLIEKMKQRLPDSGLEDDCPGMMCPGGDYGDNCCPDDSLTCCDPDSAMENGWVCVEDPDTCDECRGMMCPMGDYGDICCWYDSNTCCDVGDYWLCAPDPDDCNNPNPTTMTKGHAKKNPLLMKMWKHNE